MGKNIVDDSPLATQLAHDLSMSDGVTRWLYWMQAIENATTSDMNRLVHLAHGNSVAEKLVAARWIELSPQHMFETLTSSPGGNSNSQSASLLNTLFEEWAKRDPEATIAALNSPAAASLNHWRHRIATTVFATDVERGLTLMADWNIENYGPNMSSVAKWAAADPRHAMEFTLAHGKGSAAWDTIDAIGKTWAQSDPAAAMTFAKGLQGEVQKRFALATAREWAQRDLPGAANWLGEADIATRNRLSPAIAEAWASKDAAGALAWIESNLTGQSLERAVGSALNGVANQDIQRAASLVSSMQPSAARAEAAVVVAKKWVPEFTSAKPPLPETIQWLSALDNTTLERVMQEVSYVWASNDPRSLASFITAPDREFLSDGAFRQLVRSWARQNPQEALDWANQLPRHRRNSTGEILFTEWRQWQSEPAFKWLGQLPLNDPRRRIYFENAIRNMAFENQPTPQLDFLSPDDRIAARKVLEDVSIPEAGRRKVARSLEGP
jgi:hypothetical protein